VRRLIVGLIAAVLVASGMVAYAKLSPRGVITVCVNPQTHALQWDHCGSNWHRVSWNQRPGYVTVWGGGVLDPDGGQQDFRVECPSTHPRVISGGYEFSPSSGPDGQPQAVPVLGSFPHAGDSGRDSGWEIRVSPQQGMTGTLGVSAVCAHLGP
jgi:hypothetical protein